MQTTTYDCALLDGLIVRKQPGNKMEDDSGAAYRRITQWIREPEFKLIESMGRDIPDAMMVHSTDYKGYQVAAIYRPNRAVRLECRNNPCEYPEQVKRPSEYIRG